MMSCAFSIQKPCIQDRSVSCLQFLLTPEAERLFLESFTATKEHFQQSLDALRAAHLDLRNTDFDTGATDEAGEYPLADDTYDELLWKLAAHAFANVSAGLRSNLVVHDGDVDAPSAGMEAQRKRSSRVRNSSRSSSR